MRTLIVKLGASGDVIRTTTLLHILDGEVDWLTSELNLQLLAGLDRVNAVAWPDRARLRDRAYDLVINLEDSADLARELRRLRIRSDEAYGACVNSEGLLTYTGSSAAWFDLGIISRYGIDRANILKFKNRKTYQEHLFRGLGREFSGQPYLLPPVPPSDLFGDVAIASEAGTVWPMKNWAFYGRLAGLLRADGLKVNVLPKRPTMLGHIADIRNHRLLVSGDSLPMHCALGSGVPCVTLFTCTSPWEIYDYGIQTKMVSPLLEKYFYRRDFDRAAVEAITVDEVYERCLSACGQGMTR